MTAVFGDGSVTVVNVNIDNSALHTAKGQVIGGVLNVWVLKTMACSSIQVSGSKSTSAVKLQAQFLAGE